LFVKSALHHRILGFGAGDDPTDAEMVPGWWSD